MLFTIFHFWPVIMTVLLRYLGRRIYQSGSLSHARAWQAGWWKAKRAMSKTNLCCSRCAEHQKTIAGPLMEHLMGKPCVRVVLQKEVSNVRARKTS